MGFSRQRSWSGLPFTYPGDLPDPGIESMSSALQMDSLLLSHQEALNQCLTWVRSTTSLRGIGVQHSPCPMMLPFWRFWEIRGTCCMSHAVRNPGPHHPLHHQSVFFLAGGIPGKIYLFSSLRCPTSQSKSPERKRLFCRIAGYRFSIFPGALVLCVLMSGQKNQTSLSKAFKHNSAGKGPLDISSHILSIKK